MKLGKRTDLRLLAISYELSNFFEGQLGLNEIWNFIARHDVSAATRGEAEIQASIRMLAESPGIGHIRPDLGTRYRVWRVYSYLIIYRVEKGTLVVVRVIHGMRNVGRLLRRK